MLCWSRGLSSRGRNASTRGHNNESVELKAKTATWPLWLLMPPNQQAKKGGYSVDWGKLDYYPTKKARKSIPGMLRIP